MKREIKFRAWDEKLTQMFYVDIYEYMSWNEISQDEAISYNARKNSLMQYTGLKDENGKEIYEGDIIKSTWNGRKYVVKWNEAEGEWGFCSDCNTDTKYKGTNVIGNIYENPELINTK